MEKKIVRIIVALKAATNMFRLGESPVGYEGWKVDVIVFRRDGLTFVNTTQGMKERQYQPCYFVRLVDENDDKLKRLIVVPYDKVETIEYTEELVEEEDQCETATVELKKAE